MAVDKAARSSGNCSRAKTRTRVGSIVTDWELGTFWAGLVLAASFALMGIVAGWLGW